MHKRLTAMLAVAVLGIATVLWVSANPQEKSSVKPAVVKSGGSCCAHEGAAQAKGGVKPASMQGNKGECPYLKSAAAANDKKDCANCPEMKAILSSKEGSKAHGGCPFMKSNSNATAAKAKPAPTKTAARATPAKATTATKTAKDL